MSMIYKEGLKIDPPVLNEIILGANQDVRQVRHSSKGQDLLSKKAELFIVCRL